jgi:hypothetical protein
VVLNNACTAGDVVVIEVYTLTSISNALPLTGGTVTGASTFNSTLTVNGAAVSGFTGFKNRIINPGMVIDQRNAGASITPASGVLSYAVDRFNIEPSQASKLTAQQNQNSVTPPTGFSNYLGVTSSSAYAVLTSDYFLISQRIEGFNTADLAWGTASAATVTLSFWVRSSLTGTFGGSITNNAFNRSYPFAYSILAANTWEQKTITIAGDTSGTWVGATNGTGMRVYWSLGSGSTYIGTAGAWSGSGLLSATGATSVVGTNGATFYLTGVQLERGSNATSFEFRDYGRELMMCQRYYYQIGGDFSGNVSYQFFANGVITNTTNAAVIQQFPVMMRSAPSFSVTNPSNLRIGGAGYFTVTAAVLDVASLFNANINYTSSGMTAGQGCSILQNATSLASLNFSAEL